MGRWRRGLVGVALLATCACGSTHPIASAATFVPWKPLPPGHHLLQPTSPPPLAVPAGTAACQAWQVEGVALAGGAAAGNVNMPLLFRNKSDSDCALRGYADVTVVNGAGRVLANGFGAAGRGTFFADGPVVSVLLQKGTPRLQEPGAHADGALGQAFMNLSWYDCASPQADHLTITMPDSGGVMTVAFPFKGDANPACFPGSNAQPAVFRGPFSPASPHLPPFPLSAIGVAISAPQSARHGTTVIYFVTVTNNSSSAFDLRPCADYVQMLQKTRLSTYQLSCDAVAPLAPGMSYQFEMRADIPASTVLGRSRLGWFLNDGRIAEPFDSVPLTIT